MNEKKNLILIAEDDPSIRTILSSELENKFNVKVKKVSTINVKGKMKNATMRSNGNILRTSGNRSNWKKAIITLQEGSSIDILGVALYFLIASQILI